MMSDGHHEGHCTESQMQNTLSQLCELQLAFALVVSVSFYPQVKRFSHFSKCMASEKYPQALVTPGFLTS